jgi:hypothetical protein
VTRMSGGVGGGPGDPALLPDLGPTVTLVKRS